MVCDRQWIAVTTISQHELTLVVCAPNVIWILAPCFLERATNNAAYDFMGLRRSVSWISGYHDCFCQTPEGQELPCLKIDFHSGHRMRVIFQKDETVYIQRLRRFLEKQNKEETQKTVLLAPLRPWHPSFGYEALISHVKVRLFGKVTYLAGIEHVTPYPKTLWIHDEYPPLAFEFDLKLAEPKLREVILDRPDIYTPVGHGNYQVTTRIVRKYSPFDAYFFDQLSILLPSKETNLAFREEVSLKDYLGQ